MPLNYTWYNQTFGAHPSSRADFEKYFDSSGRYSQVTFGGGGIYTGPLNFSGNGEVPNPLPSFLPTANVSFKLEGFIYIPTNGDYSFRANGDDAVDIIIDGQVVSYWYNSHGFHNGTSIVAPSSWIGTITLTKGYHHFITRFESVGGGLGMEISWKKPGDSAYYVIPNTQFNTEYISNIHKDTPLPIKTCIPVDKDTVFLAHYDITEEESLFGLQPTNDSVFTLRSQEGKYGGGIAIEENTTNYMNQSLAGWNSAPVGTDISTWMGYPVYYTDGKTGGAGFYHSNNGIVELAVGATATYSMWINRGTADKFPGFYLQGSYYDSSTSTWINKDPIHGYITLTFQYFDQYGNSLGSSLDYTTFTGWVKVVVSIKNTHTDSIRLTNVFFLDSYFTSGRCYHSQPQMENKPFATSFTTSSRNSGKLSYPIDKSIWEGSFSFTAWTKLSTTIGWRMPAGTWGKWYFAWGSGSASSLVVSWLENGSQVSYNVDVSGLNCLNWNFIGFTYDRPNKTIKIYANGKLVGTKTAANLNATSYSDLGIGTLGGGDTSYPLNGLVDEVRIDRRAVSDDEIEQWYLSQSPFFPKGVHRVYA